MLRLESEQFGYRPCGRHQEWSRAGPRKGPIPPDGLLPTPLGPAPPRAARCSAPVTAALSLQVSPTNKTTRLVTALFCFVNELGGNGKAGGQAPPSTALRDAPAAGPGPGGWQCPGCTLGVRTSQAVRRCGPRVPERNCLGLNRSVQFGRHPTYPSCFVCGHLVVVTAWPWRWGCLPRVSEGPHTRGWCVWVREPLRAWCGRQAHPGDPGLAPRRNSGLCRGDVLPPLWPGRFCRTRVGWARASGLPDSPENAVLVVAVLPVSKPGSASSPSVSLGNTLGGGERFPGFPACSQF